MLVPFPVSIPTKILIPIVPMKFLLPPRGGGKTAGIKNHVRPQSRQSVLESRRRLQWRQPTALKSDAETSRAKARRLKFNMGGSESVFV